MNWEFHTFQTLDTRKLFDLMKLRTDVFVVEQQCAYPELDDLDTLPGTLHFLGFDQQVLGAYARAMPLSVTGNGNQNTIVEVKIGRVVVSKSLRGTGIAQQLITRLIEHLEQTYPGVELALSAQEPIINFYQDFGFSTESDVYLEDGIPHIDMRRTAKNADT